MKKRRRRRGDFFFLKKKIVKLCNDFPVFFFFNVEGIDLIKDFNLDDVPRSKYRHYPMICISLHLVDE
jgi:hypothetical protein